LNTRPFASLQTPNSERSKNRRHGLKISRLKLLKASNSKFTPALFFCAGRLLQYTQVVFDLPMRSNKKKNRGKGKAKARRKTNAAATATVEEECALAVAPSKKPAQTAHQILLSIGRGLMSGDEENHPCLHGVPSLNLSDQPECFAFLHNFFNRIEQRDNGGHIVNAAAQAMQETLPNFPVAWLNETNQKLINAWFVCIGVTCLLQVTTTDGSNDNDPAAAMALATLELEDFCSASFSESVQERKEVSMTVLTEDGRGKVRDLLCGGERALTKFFRRRIKCKCLDSKYAEVKELPRTGSCSWCNTRRKLRDLKICKGCQVCHYCGIECQGKAWPQHKAFCGSYLTDILAAAGCDVTTSSSSSSSTSADPSS
jgi:hypothetical protein